MPISFIMMKLFSLFKSETIITVGMGIDKALYCLVFVILTCLCINHFQVSDGSVLFAIFCTAIPLVYFIFFFQDKRLNAEKRLANSTSDYQSYLMQEMIESKNKIDMIIESVFIILFIPLSFFSNLLVFPLAVKGFNLVLWIYNVKYLGLIIGLYGAFSLFRYIKTVLLLPYLIIAGKMR